MADLTSNFAGIKSPNPFWLASAPPPNKDSTKLATQEINFSLSGERLIFVGAN